MGTTPLGFTWPIYIVVKDGKVESVWYDSENDGQDYLLTDDEHFHVDYEQTEQVKTKKSFTVRLQHTRVIEITANSPHEAKIKAQYELAQLIAEGKCPIEIEEIKGADTPNWLSPKVYKSRLSNGEEK